MKRTSLVFALVALFSLELSCAMSGAIASTSAEDVESKLSLIDSNMTKHDYTPPLVGTPTRTEGGGTR